MKKIYFTFLIAVACLSSFSQVNLMGYGSFVRNLNPDYRGNTYGGGIRFEFAKNETFTKYAGFAYDVPMYSTEEIEAQAYSSWTTPSSQTVTARYSRPMMRFEFGANYYLSGDATSFEGLNWYLTVGAEIIYIGNKPTYSSYDKENYTLGYTDNSDVNEDGSEKYGLHLFLMGGTGIEKTLGPGNIFLQATIGLPATNIGSSNVSSSIEDFTPIPLNINIGYKISLGSRND
jgi:hypothetical protein